MSPVGHLVLQALVARRLTAREALLGVAPDIGNLPLLSSSKWLPEKDWRVRLSRAFHSPIIGALLLLASRSTWPWAFHLLVDYLSHPPERRPLWPLR